MRPVVRNLLIAALLSVTGVAVMGVGIAVGLNGWFAMTAVLQDSRHLDAFERVWAFVVGMAKLFGFVIVPTLIGTLLSALGVRLLNRGRRLVLAVIQEHSRLRGGPTVLYLRPFRHDEAASRPYSVYFLTGVKTQEEQIGDAFAWIGRLIAIRQPGQDLSYLGARRIFPTSQEWRDEVIAQMQRASVILIRAHMGTAATAQDRADDAVIWELRTAIGLALPNSVYLLAPANALEYERFRTAANPFLPQPLPRWNFKVESDFSADVAGVIAFDDAWRATAHPLRVRSLSPFPLQGALRRFIRQNEGLRAMARWSPRVWAKSVALGLAYVSIGAGMSLGLSAWFRPPLDRAARAVGSLHVFDDPRRTRFLEALPGSLRQPFRREFEEHPQAERWITIDEGLTPTALAESALAQVENLPDARLLTWAEGFHDTLASRDIPSCASLVRSLTAVREPGKARSITGLLLTGYTLHPENLLSFAAQMPPRYQVAFPGLLIEAAQAPRPAATGAPSGCSATEVLRTLQGTVPNRWNEISAGLHGYSDLDDRTLCEFQRAWLAAITSAEPRLQRCLVRMWASRLSPMRWHLSEPLEKQVSAPESERR